MDQHSNDEQRSRGLHHIQFWTGINMNMLKGAFRGLKVREDFLKILKILRKKHFSYASAVV